MLHRLNLWQIRMQTMFVTVANKQLAESHYNTTWRAPRGTGNENTGVSAKLDPETPEFVLATLFEENPWVIHNRPTTLVSANEITTRSLKLRPRGRRPQETSTSCWRRMKPLRRQSGLGYVRSVPLMRVYPCLAVA